ncbi:hypothetical protein, partial [Paraburkholderia strydomiana]|uniref:hypothetical protein n=1 Tax=Paraburkholderia strydomiana TaxID=1245417 RepID=UPI001BE513C6
MISIPLGYETPFPHLGHFIIGSDVPTVVAALGAARFGWLAAEGDFSDVARPPPISQAFVPNGGRRPDARGAIGLVPSAVQPTISTFPNVMLPTSEPKLSLESALPFKSLPA